MNRSAERKKFEQHRFYVVTKKDLFRKIAGNNRLINIVSADNNFRKEGLNSTKELYFDIDPVIVRLIMVVLFLTAGIGLLAYIIAWAVIPAARSREELSGLTNGNPVTFNDISRNVEEELKDLKKRGEQMSHELKDFFSKKK